MQSSHPSPYILSLTEAQNRRILNPELFASDDVKILKEIGCLFLDYQNERLAHLICSNIDLCAAIAVALNFAHSKEIDHALCLKARKLLLRNEANGRLPMNLAANLKRVSIFECIKSGLFISADKGSITPSEAWDDLIESCLCDHQLQNNDFWLRSDGDAKKLLQLVGCHHGQS